MKNLNKILAQFGEALICANVLWGVGASLLLYQYGLVDTITDIDIVVAKEDVERADKILSAFGKKQTFEESDIFKTEYFYEYHIQDIDIDLIAGFKIVSAGGNVYSYLFDRESIAIRFEIDGVQLPFTSLEDWYVLYQLIPDKEMKVKKIEDHFLKNGLQFPFLLERMLDQKFIPEMVKSRSLILFTN